jgi:serine phosphatase RsbU (regulator of sigma subunit)
MRALAMAETRPDELLHALNALLLASGLEYERFCTALFGFITVDDGIVLDLANAGHPYPWRRDRTGAVEELRVDGSLLGVFEVPEYEARTFRLEPGAQLVLFTDGVLEARHDDVFFSASGVAEVLATSSPGAEHAAARLERAVLDHIGGMPTDDMAIVVLEAELSPVRPVIDGARR